MGYIQHYLQTMKASTSNTLGAVRTYDLPGLAGQIPAAYGKVDSFKREYNRALNQYRQIHEELEQRKQHMFYSREDRKKQLLGLEAHMQKMLVKIGSYNDEELRGGFDVDQSQRTS